MPRRKRDEESIEVDTPKEETPKEPDSFTAPPYSIPEDKTPETPKVEEPETDQKVALRVFVGVSGKRQDQMMGFVYHAKKGKLGPMSVKAWQTEYEKFMTKPVI